MQDKLSTWGGHSSRATPVHGHNGETGREPLFPCVTTLYLEPHDYGVITRLIAYAWSWNDHEAYMDAMELARHLFPCTNHATQ